MAKLEELVRVGDVILTCPNKGGIGTLIAKFTFGKVNHAAIVYDNVKLFETDGDQYRSTFNNISKYDGREVFLIRAKYMKERAIDLQRICKQYHGFWYSYWDIATNAMFFWLTRQLRTKVVGFFGSKNCMVCSELVARVLFETTGNKIWKDFEGITPEDIRDIALENPEQHTIIHFNPNVEE